MKIWITPHAYWRLQWMAQRTDSEISSMGVLSLEKHGFTIVDAVLVKQEVSVSHVNLDMEWWAEKQVELFEQRGIEPWQTSCWIHTHPEGVDRPSSTDEETMRESFGTWGFAIMIILTKCGRFYARVDFNHDFGGGFQQRFNLECEVSVLWTRASDHPIGRDTLQTWDQEIQELVTETEPLWSSAHELFPRRKVVRAAPDIDEIDINGASISIGSISEVGEYVRACITSGVEPDDPEVFERYFGREPTQEDIECLAVEGGFLEW